MGQQKLNHLMILNAHKDCTDSLNLIDIAKDFIADSEHRLKANLNLNVSFCDY